MNVIIGEVDRKGFELKRGDGIFVYTTAMTT